MVLSSEIAPGGVSHRLPLASRPKVSVIIPTYNRANYIAAAIQSVLDQTLRDVEVVVVDDGSTDDTAERLAPVAGKLNYVRTGNQGPARARNEGMRRATGEYIAYLDSDDLYYPYKLQAQAEVLDRYPGLGLVYSEFSAFDDHGWFDEWHLREYHSSAYRRSSGLTYDRFFSEQVTLSQLAAFAQSPAGFRPEWLQRRVYFGHIFDAYLMNTVVFTNSIMFRASLLEGVGFQDPRFGLFHDLEFVLRMCRNYPVAFIDAPTYKLRYHAGQISTTIGPERGLIAIRKQRDLLRVFKAHHCDEPDYYFSHKALMDRQLARLLRSVAVPMLSLDRGSRHEDRYYPRRARKYLRRCAALGYPEPFLWLLSFAPHFGRRVGMAVIDRRQKLIGALKRVMGHRDPG
jgi:glycosyltransferase involved in cell wall biosynthesis